MFRLGQSAIIIQMIRSLKNSRSWCGETHIQKALYIMQTLFNIDIGFNYILYKYGPYSFELKEKITNMLIEGEISRVYNDPPVYGPTFIVGEKAERYSKIFQTLTKEYIDKIEYVANKIGSSGVYELENLATALYFHKRNPKFREGWIATQIIEIKPHIQKDIAIEAAKRIVEMEKEIEKTA